MDVAPRTVPRKIDLEQKCKDADKFFDCGERSKLKWKICSWLTTGNLLHKVKHNLEESMIELVTKLEYQFELALKMLWW
jgi:hypothetical protein